MGFVDKGQRGHRAAHQGRISYLCDAVKSRQFRLRFLRFRQLLSGLKNLRDSSNLALSRALFRGSVTVWVGGLESYKKGERMQNVAEELTSLEAMRVADLRDKYAQVFGEETRVGNKAW